MEGIVLGGSNNFFDVEGEDGVIRLCSLKSKRLKTDDGYYNPLAPNDRVEFEVDSLDKLKGQIIEAKERKNKFVRYNVKKRLPQVMACNLDYLVIVTTPDEPPFRPRFIDRALAQAEYENIEPIIVCNKIDLPSSEDIDLENRLEIWEDLGYKVFRLSAKSGEGLAELAECLAEKTSAFVGQSGIGKSSLINALSEGVHLRTNELSSKYIRGTHTTTKGELMRIELKSSLLEDGKRGSASFIDTPGVRRFVLHNIASGDLAYYFREFRPLLGKCTYGLSCSHKCEAGCKIQEAVYAGVIAEERYESWCRISDEIESGSWED